MALLWLGPKRCIRLGGLGEVYAQLTRSTKSFVGYGVAPMRQEHCDAAGLGIRDVETLLDAMARTMRVPSNYALRLPASLKKAAEGAASRDGATLNQFIVAAVAEKLGAYGAAEFFATRRERADLDAFDEILRRPGGVEPPKEDRM